MDEASSRVRLKSFVSPPDLKEIEDRLSVVRTEKEAAIASQEYEQAARLRDEEQKVCEELDNKQKERKQAGADRMITVTSR